MIFFGKTDIGQQRDTNQDCFGAYALARDTALLIVCDGMGGENGGEIASGLALETFTQQILRICRPKLSADNTLLFEEKEVTLMLKNALAAANKAVYECARSEPGLAGMGTTLVAALVLEEGRYVFWLSAGDSRLYRISREEITQISHDHSYVQYLVDTGEISPREAKTHKDRNLITKAVGIDELLNADLDAFEVDEEARELGTYLLLCSDGLTNMLEKEEIQQIVTCEDIPPEDRVALLIEMANRNGGTDNITAALIKL